jgi:hypothetical protein
MIKKTFNILLLVLFFLFLFPTIGYCGGWTVTAFIFGVKLFTVSVKTIVFIAAIASAAYSIYSTISADRLDAPTTKYASNEISNSFSNERVVPIIYGGPIVVGGNYVWQTDPGKTVRRFLSLCVGEVSSIGSVKLNEINISGLSGSSYTAYTGTSTQSVDSRAEGEVKGLHDVAYLALTIQANEDISGNPVASCAVTGRKIKTWNSGTSSWDTNALTTSSNPAAVVRDYLILSPVLGGAGISEDFIDNDSFGDVYEFCAASIDDGNGGAEERYHLDIVVDTKHAVLDNLNKMLINFNGGIFRSADKYKLTVEQPNKIAEVPFTEDNIIRDSFFYGYGDADDTPNQVGVEWIDSTVVKNPLRTEYVEDELDQEIRGKRLETIPCRGIIRQSQASRMAKKVMYERKVNDIWCQFRANIEGLELEPGDVISVTHSRPNWTAALFRIVEMKEGLFGVSEYMCQAYNSSLLDDRHATRFFSSWDYGAPANPFEAVEDVSGLTLEEDGWRNADGVHIAHIIASWTLPETGLEQLDSFIIDLKKGTDDYITVGAAPAASTSYRINLNLEIDEDYIVRIRTKNRESVTSSGTVSDTIHLVGKDSPPSDVTAFIVKKYRDVIVCKWQDVSDKDVDKYEIRKGASWDSGKVIESNIAKNDVTLRDIKTGTNQSYWIKAIDNSRNYSENAKEAIITVGFIPFQNIIQTYDEGNNWLDNSNIYYISGEDNEHDLRKVTNGKDLLAQSFTPSESIELKQVHLKLKKYG